MIFLLNHRSNIMFEDLMGLTSREAFYSKDVVVSDVKYRMFNYRLASYSEFCLPSALESRGIMFELDENDRPIRIASRPPIKFFNAEENPFTMNLDYSKIARVMTKMDGSLISTYYHPNHGVRLKSKMSIDSDQSNAAESWLKNNDDLARILEKFAIDGYTVNMEWISPDNRIVIGYPEERLVILQVRHNETGETIFVDQIPEMKQFGVTFEEVADPVKFVKKIPEMMDIEGFVIQLEDGMLVKMKTMSYLALHKVKDNINSNKKLFEAVVMETTDDMRQMFIGDQMALDKISKMEEFVRAKYNHMVAMCDNFYETNKHLERKDYAIKGQLEIKPSMYFSRVMNLYLGKDPDYKNFMVSKYREFGIKDDDIVEE